ncbi:MAG TPA: MazG family protein [Egibacteraceae bacterium]|nr:MazG family protein [Egibacteraceae bacterium]
MDRLLEVMRRLRAPDGCPWDREQTHLSLRPYLLEEAAEAVDALGGDDPLEAAGELGDVLLQVAFHAVIAEEEGAYDYGTIEGAIVEKLIRRHPHVFGDVHAPDSDAVVRNWQAIKAEERSGKPEKHPAERVPRSLGALARYREVSKAAGRPKGDREAVLAALREAAGPEGVAEVLAAVADWARGEGVDAELALRERADAIAREAAARP